MPSLPRSGLGLTLLALLASGAPAQQKKQVQPSSDAETIDLKLRLVSDAAQTSLAETRESVRPTRFEWSEMLLLDASLSPDKRLERARRASNHPSFQAARAAQPSGGSVEKLGPFCLGFAANPPAGSTDWTSVTDATGSPYPANAAGSVGPNHLMTMTQSDTLIQDRFGVTISTVTTDSFWSPLLPPSVSNCRLNFISYVGIAGHWVATARGGAGAGATTIMWAVSASNDPTGSWDFYSITADPGATTFADGLTQGYNSNWVAVTADMYTSLLATGNAGSRLYTIDLPEATDGDLDPVTFNTFPSSYWPGPFAVTTNYRCVVARHMDNSLADLWIVNSRTAFGSGENGWAACSLTGTGAAPVFVVTPSPIGSALFIPTILYSNGRQGVAQIGDARLIDPLKPDGINISTRVIISDAVVRNGHIFTVSRNGGAGPQAAAATRGAIRFSELDANPFVIPGSGIGPYVQEVQIDDGINTTCMYPSIAVNCAEDVLIGFTRSDVTKNVEAAFCARLGGDALGTMGPTTTLRVGDDAWWQAMPPPGSATLGAWGFYSSSAIDPNDDRTLWTLQQYAAVRAASPGVDADSRWGTWWGRFGNCEDVPVSIFDQPDDVLACVGDPVSFTVGATLGASAFTYQWRLDGNDIAGATSSTYSIPVSTALDEGTYDVVVIGCGATLSDPAVLDFGEPTITTQPAHQTAPYGGTVTFTVAATPSIGTLSYQWMHGATPVGIDSPSHTVSGIIGSDYGLYHVVVTDGCGPTTSDTAILKVPTEGGKHLPIRLLDVFIDPNSKIGCVGGTATFTSSGAPPGSTYVWRKDGSAIVPPETGPNLVLGPLSFADAGVYDVVVTFGTETDDSNNAPMIMADKPVITDQPNNVNLASPGPCTFTVVATGQAPLSYQWQKKPPASMLPFTNIPGATEASLVFETATSANEGSYRCVVTNLCGFTRSAPANLNFF